MEGLNDVGLKGGALASDPNAPIETVVPGLAVCGCKLGLRTLKGAEV